MIKKVLTIFLISLIALVSCETKRVAKGPTDVIYVLASDEVKNVLQPAIDTTFSFGIRTPQFQRYFYTEWHSFDELSEYIYYPNTIVIADLNRNDAATQFIKGMLNNERYESIKQDTVAMFALEDYWRRIQMFVAVAGYDMDKLSAYILERQGWLYGKFNNKYKERQLKYIYNKYEQRNLAEKLWEKYHWSFRVPSDYFILHEYPMRNFVWLGRGLPYRWMSVSWAAGIKTEWLTANGLFNKRNEIGKIYRNIRTEEKFLGHKFVKFGQWNALRMYGLWYNEEKPQGGPFVSYAFYDEASDRTYVIDLMAFCPGEKYTNYIRQLELIAETFRTTEQEAPSEF